MEKQEDDCNAIGDNSVDASDDSVDSHSLLKVCQTKRTLQTNTLTKTLQRGGSVLLLTLQILLHTSPHQYFQFLSQCKNYSMSKG